MDVTPTQDFSVRPTASPVYMSALPRGSPAAPPKLVREKPHAARYVSDIFLRALDGSLSNFTQSVEYFKKYVVQNAKTEEEQREAYDHLEEVKEMLNSFVMAAPNDKFGGKRKSRRRKTARRRVSSSQR